MYLTAILFILFLYGIDSFNTGLRGTKNPTTINEIDINMYTGNWYQMYGAPTNYIFQGYGKCLTAQYGLLENGNVSVINSQINVEGQLEQITGYAYYKNSSEPGKLTVHLDGTPVDGPYWIIKLGELKNNQYQYSIITTQSAISLWVIARDILDFYNNYDKEVKQYLDNNEFKYTSINQNDSCEYFFK